MSTYSEIIWNSELFASLLFVLFIYKYTFITNLFSVAVVKVIITLQTMTHIVNDTFHDE